VIRVLGNRATAIFPSGKRARSSPTQACKAAGFCSTVNDSVASEPTAARRISWRWSAQSKADPSYDFRNMGRGLHFDPPRRRCEETPARTLRSPYSGVIDLTASEYALRVRASRSARSSLPSRRTSGGPIRKRNGTFPPLGVLPPKRTCVDVSTGIKGSQTHHSEGSHALRASSAGTRYKLYKSFYSR
jgi:hypothetical protein